MSPVQTRSRSSLMVAAASMKEMALLRRSSTGSLKRGRVSMTPKSSVSSSANSSSSVTCCPAPAAAAATRKGGKMACRNKEFRVEVRGLDTNVCSHISMCKGTEGGGSATMVAAHASYSPGKDNGDSMAHTTVIKCHHDEGENDNENMDVCAIGGIKPLRTAPVIELEGWWDEESSCSTPKAAECKIPVDACLVCPPAPRKRKVAARCEEANSPFPTLVQSESVPPPPMILPHFIDAFFASAERSSL